MMQKAKSVGAIKPPAAKPTFGGGCSPRMCACFCAVRPTHMEKGGKRYDRSTRCTGGGSDAGGDAVASLKYKATATHGAGVTAKDNLGSDSNPAVAIAAGTKSKETAAYTPFRNYFYGATAEKPTLNSDYIRSLTKSGKAYAAGTLTINVPVGAQRVAIACIATAKGVTKVINETAMNADVTSTFTKSTVSVEGANGYSAKDYNIWIFEPAVAYGNAAVLKVTLG